MGAPTGALAATAGPAGATTTRFTTPGCSIDTVPAGVTEVALDVYGAQGGTGGFAGDASPGGPGGLGGHAAGVLGVTPDEQLDVCVGGEGGSVASTAGTSPGGFNGGGAGNNVVIAVPGGGGGASDVRVGGTGLANRVIVAGGGGGGTTGSAPAGGAGGAGGGPSGVDCVAQSPWCGGAGTQTGGGPAGQLEYPAGCPTPYSPLAVLAATGGALGTGGPGGDDVCVRAEGPPITTGGVGGGGGGGWYGGGGGGAGGGGGGSGYVAPSIQANGPWLDQAGDRSGDGEVDVSTVFPPTITSAATATFDEAVAGTFTVTATGSPAPTYSVTGAPSWLSIDPATGALGGTPPPGSAGTYRVTVAATNGVGPDATQSFALTVVEPPGVVIWTTSIAEGLDGHAYSSTLTAVGGNPPYRWTVVSGRLPTNVHLQPYTGVINGRPNVTGAFPFTVAVVDHRSADPPHTQHMATRAYTLVVW